MWFCNCPKSLKTIRITWFPAPAKTLKQNLIKTDEFHGFWRITTKNVIGMINKPLGFSLLQDGFWGHSQNVKNHWLDKRWQHLEIIITKPCKPAEFQSFSLHFRKSGTKTIKKRLGFSVLRARDCAEPHTLINLSKCITSGPPQIALWATVGGP